MQTLATLSKTTLQQAEECRRRNGENGVPQISDGTSPALPENGTASTTTGPAATQPEAGRSLIGLPHGATGAVVKLSDNPHSNAELVATSLASSLPSPVKSWLECWIKKGWQAPPLEATPELVQETRQAMAVIYKLWKPVTQTGLEDKASLIVEVNKMLSNYGYGALPADPLQAKLKVEGYVEVLEDAPLWAVQQASKNWRKRAATNPPTAGEWLMEARKEMGYFAKVTYGACGEYELAGRIYDKLVAWIKDARV